MQKESQTQFVHRIGLGERQTLSDETAKPLPQSVVASLDMSSQAGLFAHCRMLLRRDDHLIGFPKVAVTVCSAIGGGDLLPDFSTTRSASVANDIGDDLPGSTTQGNPYPALKSYNEQFLLGNNRPF